MTMTKNVSPSLLPPSSVEQASLPLRLFVEFPYATPLGIYLLVMKGYVRACVRAWEVASEII